MSYGLAFNPSNKQQSVLPTSYALNPTYGTLLSYQSPNSVNPYLNTATGTFSTFGDLTNGVNFENENKMHKLDQYNGWRSQQVHNLASNPVALAAFNKAYPPAFTFNYSLGSSGPKAPQSRTPQGLHDSDWYAKDDPNGDGSTGNGSTGYGLNSPITNKPVDEFARYYGPRAGLTPEAYRKWFNQQQQVDWTKWIRKVPGYEAGSELIR